MKNNDTVTIDYFGKEKSVKVFSTGDNKYDENGNYKEDDFELSQDEIKVLNDFIKNIKLSDYNEIILEYINEKYSPNSSKKVSIEDIEKEIDIYGIAINVCKIWKSKTGFIYPEISFYGDCKCDEENGICIGFRNNKFIGINSQDWTL